MAIYTYRCADDGCVDVRMPIGTAPETITCPSCGGPTARVFTAPMLGLADRRRMAVIDHAESTRYEPQVVSAPTGARRKRTPMAPPNPAFRGLPRP
jgi:putative FmdB family regulatory protein